MRLEDQCFAVFEEGGTDYSTAVNFTSTAVSACNALPAAWGEGPLLLDLHAPSYDCYVTFTDQSGLTASVPAASAAGAQAVGFGLIVPAGITVTVLVSRGLKYVARISPEGATSLHVFLRSDKSQIR